MRRRDFMTLFGGASVAWPLAAHAQQQPKLPMVGYLSNLAAGDRPILVNAFRQGLNESGYVEGQNVAIEYRFADNDVERLRALAADLIAREVAVIMATGGNNSGLVTKALTSTIPIVFTSGDDPVKAGLVASLNRPEGNVTGVSWFTVELGAKHVELLHELVPRASLVGVLVNPNNPESVSYEPGVRDGAHGVGVQILVTNAGTANEIDAAFANLMQQRAAAVIVASDPFYTARASQLVVLAARHAVPVIYSNREMIAAGGLISYGNSVSEAHRRAGVYAGRILKGAKPETLPIDRATKFELVVNLRTANALGLEVPPTLLARADEVIE
jgi:putative ABC transport system substrate-binding protein